ncbi:isochorismate synthase MenF [Alkalihalobacillus sp. AL-G]|uniref:isochorismate synthase n=1 Tax=Alkalihalobacillus sp. AL-G TaxID=2926399 RepID=UPI0027297797|nr:isochorismate synthase [Alkalihalobacillus sp. AL-G]WLD92479.1 isochorismate synthase [Alkalihalobacillus sp. AL-G]
MTAVKQHELIDLLERASEKARELDIEILVSHRIHVDLQDPVLVYKNGQLKYEGKRSYWSDSNNRIQMVGLGEAVRLDVHGSERFEKINSCWQSILENRIENERINYIPGTGPLLMGGFSFDPIKEKTPLWVNFPDASFVLPSYLYTVTDQKAFLTQNILVDADADLNELFNRSMEEQAEILTSIPEVFSTPSSLSYRLTDIEPEEWKNTIQNTTDLIKQGEVDKVVLAREVFVNSSGPISVYDTLVHLREHQKHSFVFAIERAGQCFVGASPERLVQKQDGEILSTCLAGSIRRGETPREDDQLGDELLSDMKNREEHAFVVRMILEAFEQVSTSVQVPSEPTLYKGRDIQHLYTPVVVKEAKDIPLLEIVNKLHPTPALGGFPQKKSVEVIRDEERLDRGWYSAPVGWIDYLDQGEFAVGIRSALLSDKHASLFAGCGIVADSDPESEYEETLIKLRPMLHALGGTQK